jgi:hypothetical protein
MSLNAEQILENSLKSINGGDAAGARRSLESWLSTNEGSASHLLALAVACRMTGEWKPCWTRCWRSTRAT